MILAILVILIFILRNKQIITKFFKQFQLIIFFIKYIMPRRSRSRGRGRSRSYRGGAGAANPASYSSGTTYMERTVGGTNEQYGRVF
jgi:hypothetical protein